MNEPLNSILPFTVESLDLRGRGLQLTTELDEILRHHTYPAPVKRLLSEAIALASLISSNLKFDGRVILQSQTNGSVRLLVVDITLPNKIRALARFDEERVQRAIKSGYVSNSALLGRGHLAITIEQGDFLERYQGVVALEGLGLERAADKYFMQSEQIPTRIRIGAKEEDGHWRAAGLMVQHMPKSATHKDLDAGDLPEGAEAPTQDENWVETNALIDTLEDDELIQQDVTPEILAFRLFNQHELRIFPRLELEAHCSCSRDRLQKLVSQFSREEQTDLTVNGKIIVSCDYCGKDYGFTAEEVTE
jgi:molecular chaperone Hsp33